MAWAEKLPSGKYRGVYRDASGKKRSAGTFARKAEAERRAGSLEVERRDSPVSEGSAKTTWGEWEKRWNAARSVAKSTARSDNGRLRDHVRPKWQSVPVRTITTHDIQEWVTELTNGGLAPSTVAKCYYLFSASMKQAAAANIIPTNPCKGISLPKIGPQPERFLTDEEIYAIRISLDEFDALVVDVLLGAGLRLGEALGLHWESVDLERKELRIEWAYDPVEYEMKAPKDHERRVIPIGTNLTKTLQTHLNSVGMGKPAPAPVVYPTNARVHTGLVLAHTRGRPFDPSNMRHRFEASVRIAYVGKGRSRHQIGSVRLHDLRHTYASRLLERGVPIEQVSRLLGHASVTTTMRYSHRRKGGWDSVRTALD